MGPETGALVIKASGVVARSRERMARHRAPGPADARHRPEDATYVPGDTRAPQSNRFSLVEKPKHRGNAR